MSSSEWETTYECRGCGRQAWGHSGRKPLDWSRLEGIDGPNSICPACVHDCLDDVLNLFREDGYDRVRVVSDPE